MTVLSFLVPAILVIILAVSIALCTLVGAELMTRPWSDDLS